MSIIDRLAGASRIGLGLAAVGRPGYINLGRASDLPAERTVEALRARAHELLDDAYAAGVGYFDVARSYGRAEEFLAGWPHARDVVVGSKWGYTYTAGWRVDAEVHETKDHTLTTYGRQVAETRELLGDRLDVYHIHSVTPESSALHDRALHRRLAADGVVVGLSTSGPGQADAIRAALKVTVDGRPLFRSVQATWNVLEPAAGAALAEARAAGCLVIVKECLANGRLTGRQDGPATEVLTEIAADLDTTPDAVALAAVLHQPWATIALSGAATRPQLAANLRAETIELDPRHRERLATLAEAGADYWQTRSRLPWA